MKNLPGLINKEINGIKVSNIIGQKNIDFFENKNYVGSFLGDIISFLENQKDYKLLQILGINYSKYSFDEKRNIYNLGGNTLLVEYLDKILRDDDITLFRNNCKENGFYSELTKEGFHFPFVGSYFDYNNFSYIIVDGLNKMDGIINKGSYKKLIINPDFYS